MNPVAALGTLDHLAAIVVILITPGTDRAEIACTRTDKDGYASLPALYCTAQYRLNAWLTLLVEFLAVGTQILLMVPFGLPVCPWCSSTAFAAHTRHADLRTGGEV